MASEAVSRPVAVPKFNTHIPFGEHHPKQFPIDTTVEWFIHPTSGSEFSDFPGQHYVVTVRFNTLKNGTPHGWGDYEFQTASMDEATSIIKTLRQNNHKWSLWLEGIRPMPDRKIIHLTFSQGWAGTLNGKSLGARDEFALLAETVGLASQDYQIRIPEVGHDKDFSIDLVFDASLSEAAAVAAMKATLVKMQTVFAENRVAKHLVTNGDDRFHVEQDAPLGVADIEDSMQHMAISDSSGAMQEIAGPTYASNARAPYFIITRDKITAMNRYMGGGPSDYWTGADIPWLIANNEKAPQGFKLDADDVKETDPEEAAKLKKGTGAV